MKTVLILHGIGGHAGIHWQQWLHDELEATGYNVVMPNLSDSDNPDRKTWLEEAIEAIGDCNTEELIIVGHSLGVTTALDYVESLNNKIEGLVLVSGFSEAYGFDLNEDFLKEKNIDLLKVAQKTKWAEVVYGDNDPYVTQEALRHVADGLDVQPLVIPTGGHLNTDTGYTQFPQLLDLIKAKA